MRDYRFYNADCGRVKGPGLFLVPARRLLRRLLRPLFQRQVELYESLDRQGQEVERRLDERLRELEARLARVEDYREAVRCDQEALARRLVALEDQVTALLEDRPALRARSA